MTIQMSNIAVVPRFQKPWALTSDLDSAGTSTCPGLPTILAALFTVLTLPSLDYPTMSVLPLGVTLSCRDPAPVLPPCTVLLFIFGLQVIALGTMDWAPRDPHSFGSS